MNQAGLTSSGETKLSTYVRARMLALLMLVVSIFVAAVMLSSLYRSSIQEARLLLGDTAAGYAKLIEAVVAFDAVHSTDFPGGAREASLSQVIDAFRTLEPDTRPHQGRSQEIILGKQGNDAIQFVFREHADRPFDAQSIPIDSELAKPMQLAISGQSGTVIGKDYRNVDVLAAHQPLTGLDLGLVVKVDMSEVRAPFFKAASISGIMALVIVSIGVFIFMRLTTPLIGQLRERRLLDESIFKAQTLFISESNSEIVFDQLLLEILNLTGSEYGFIGSMECDEDGQKHMQTLAISNIAWNRETCDFYRTTAPDGMRFTDFDVLFGEAALGGKVVFSNHDTGDPRRKGLPDGHPSVDTFAGVPIFKDRSVIGVVGLANREAGYTQELVDKLAPIWSSCAQLIAAHKSRADRLKGQKEIAQRNEDLSIALHQLAIALKENELLKQREKENIYRATASGAQHILNNLLNQLTLVELEIGRNPSFSPDVAAKLVVMKEQASELVNKLASVQKVEERAIKRSIQIVQS